MVFEWLLPPVDVSASPHPGRNPTDRVARVEPSRPGGPGRRSCWLSWGHTRPPGSPSGSRSWISPPRKPGCCARSPPLQDSPTGPGATAENATESPRRPRRRPRRARSPRTAPQPRRSKAVRPVCHRRRSGAPTQNRAGRPRPRRGGMRKPGPRRAHSTACAARAHRRRTGTHTGCAPGLPQHLTTAHVKPRCWLG